MPGVFWAVINSRDRDLWNTHPAEISPHLSNYVQFYFQSFFLISVWNDLKFLQTGDLGSSQKFPLSKRKGLFYCHVGRTWDHVLESEKGEIKKKFKKERKKTKKNLSKDTLLPWILSQLYNKDLQEADSSARQLWELHTHQTTNLGSDHHLQGYFKKDLLKIFWERNSSCLLLSSI